MNSPRRPRPALTSTALPTLGAALAASVSQGCQAPSCGPTPIDELRAHGPRAIDGLRDGRGEQALREIAIAVGLQGHRATTITGPELQPAGAVPVHQPEPRVTAGEAAEVTPSPVTPPLPVDVDGGIRAVQPTPPAPPPTPPRERVRPSGGAMRVAPHTRSPVDL
ncbi:MAG: hypothetical protein R3A48_18350 [Polyangiales bacterium]